MFEPEVDAAAQDARDALDFLLSELEARDNLIARLRSQMKREAKEAKEEIERLGTERAARG